MQNATSIESRVSDRGNHVAILLAVLLSSTYLPARAGDVTVHLDGEAGSSLVVLDAQSNVVLTVVSSGATLSGGASNVVSGAFGTVSGGLGNGIGAGGWYATIGGGYFNGATTGSTTIAGGYLNGAGGLASTVGGGAYNTAYGAYAAVPGGLDSHASGAYSFAAGRGAVAANDGAFVLADSTPAYVSSTTSNQFILRASGGTRIYSDANASVGVQLPAGGNGWSGVSDRTLKENLAPVNGDHVLEALDAMPVTTWNMRSQDPSIRHIGPMAQDFHAAFGVGEDDRHIGYSDADGVALAAIQSLYRRLRDREDEVQRLHLAIGKLDARLATLEAQESGTPRRQGGRE